MNRLPIFWLLCLLTAISAYGQNPYAQLRAHLNQHKNSANYLSPEKLPEEVFLDRCKLTIDFLNTADSYVRNRPISVRNWEIDVLRTYTRIQVQDRIMKENALPRLFSLMEKNTRAQIIYKNIKNYKRITDEEFLKLFSFFSTRSITGTPASFPVMISWGTQGSTYYINEEMELKKIDNEWIIGRNGEYRISEDWLNSVTPATATPLEIDVGTLKAPQFVELHNFYAASQNLFHLSEAEQSDLVEKNPKEVEGLLAGFTAMASPEFVSDENALKAMQKRALQVEGQLLKVKEKQVREEPSTANIESLFSSPKADQFLFEIKTKDGDVATDLIPKGKLDTDIFVFQKPGKAMEYRLSPEQMESVSVLGAVEGP